MISIAVLLFNGSSLFTVTQKCFEQHYDGGIIMMEKVLAVHFVLWLPLFHDPHCMMIRIHGIAYATKKCSAKQQKTNRISRFRC